MASGILKQKLPPNMRSDFWNDFIDAIEEESEEAKAVIANKKTLFDIDNMDADRMLELSGILGFPLDVSVDQSEDFFRKEMEAIPFKIKYKATVLLYLSLFKALSDDGMIYLYYYDSTNLIRNTYDLLDYVNGIDPSEPYYHRSKMNFTSVISDNSSLDSGLFLDQGWSLDSRTAKLNTKHLALEFFLNKTVTKDSVEYLIMPECFSFVTNNMDKFRKATEVIHVGCQLGAITDNSGYYNSSGHTYTMPSIKLNCVTTTNFSSITDVSEITYMMFGIGKLTNLPSTDSTGTVPTALNAKIAKVKILDVEKYENSAWMGVSAEYIGNMINDEVIGTGDGSTTSFTSTLAHTPVKPNNVKLTFTSGDTEYNLEDDGFGALTGTNAEGTINYSTGEIYVSTDIYYQTSETAGTGDGTTLNFSYTTLKPSIKTNSILFKYIISGTTYTAKDNGSGVITGNSVSGTIDYTTGVVSLTYTLAPANATVITMIYSYKKTTVPDLNTSIVTAYYFLNGSIEITEAGITDASKNLLAYATFPPIKFKSYKNHLTMFFMIKKSSF